MSPSQPVLSLEKLRLMRIVNLEGKTLGAAKDFVLTEEGSVDYIILAFSKLLGLDDKYFAVPWSYTSIVKVRDSLKHHSTH